MQTAISWSNYVTGALIVTAGYYLFIGYRFYREDIAAIFSGKAKLRFPQKTKSETGHQETSEDKLPMRGSFDELEEVVEDLRTTILGNAGAIEKPALLLLLAGRLENYAGLRRPAFRVAVNHYIIRQAEETCGITFTETELNSQWEQLWEPT